MLQCFIRFPEFAEFTEFLFHLGKTPMRSFNTLNYIHNNQNIAWDNWAYSLITKTHYYYIANGAM